MSEPPPKPYDPTQHYAAQWAFRGILPSQDSTDSWDSESWEVENANIMASKWQLETSTRAPQSGTRFGDQVRQQPMMPEWGNMEADDVDATPRCSEAFPHPSLSLPNPTLKFDFRMSVTLNPVVIVGSAPSGFRRWVSFTGGSWSGSFGSGTVQPGGQDIQLITESRSAKLSTNYLLETHDSPPAYIMAKTSGWRTGPVEVLEALDDPERADNVDPRTYKFRIFVELETGDERYKEKLNTGMWIGSGMRKGAEVLYDAYRIN